MLDGRDFLGDGSFDGVVLRVYFYGYEEDRRGDMMLEEPIKDRCRKLIPLCSRTDSKEEVCFCVCVCFFLGENNFPQLPSINA